MTVVVTVLLVGMVVVAGTDTGTVVVVHLTVLDVDADRNGEHVYVIVFVLECLGEVVGNTWLVEAIVSMLLVVENGTVALCLDMINDLG